MRYRGVERYNKTEFQSAPAIAGGRCPAREIMREGWPGFNPRPPLLAGDACSPYDSPDCAVGFNPRPPLLAGDAIQCLQCGRQVRVSIRARHCWRAMPVTGSPVARHQAVSIRARHCWRAMPLAGCSRHAPEMFQSAPAIAGGRCTSPCEISGIDHKFQSAPAIAGGRCSLRHRQTAHCRWSFNPRPPLLAGDACATVIDSPSILSFNPRPPLLAGDARH